jgi:hypothetical protein
VNIHAPGTAGDRRPVVFIHAFQVVQPDACGVLSRNRIVGRADQQRRPFAVGRLRPRIGSLKLAGKPVFAAFFTMRHGEKSDVQFRITIAGKTERADDLYQADDLLALHVVFNPCASRDQDAIAGFGHSLGLPRSGIGPFAILYRANGELDVILMLVLASCRLIEANHQSECGGRDRADSRGHRDDS